MLVDVVEPQYISQLASVVASFPGFPVLDCFQYANAEGEGVRQTGYARLSRRQTDESQLAGATNWKLQHATPMFAYWKQPRFRDMSFTLTLNNCKFSGLSFLLHRYFLYTRTQLGYRFHLHQLRKKRLSPHSITQPISLPGRFGLRTDPRKKVWELDQLYLCTQFTVYSYLCTCMYVGFTKQSHSCLWKWKYLCSHLGSYSITNLKLVISHHQGERGWVYASMQGPYQL